VGEALGAVLLVAAGTYLMRLLPLHLALRGRGKFATGALAEALNMAGPALIAAFLVVSVLPPQQQIATGELLRRSAALLAVLLAQRRWANLGASVAVGIGTYAVVTLPA
jgi:branched-subunit amino acid transport protein